ncbi:MAG: hypothetical protein KDC54_06195 [Lewinella sp.]|nr:hypothetical protein [Lewinella sp.]
MDTRHLIERVRHLIMEGRLEDAADEIITFFDQEVMDKQEKDAFFLYNQAIHQVSQLNELRRQELAGLLDPDNVSTRRNQIRQALLDLNHQLGELDLPAKTGEKTTKGEAGSAAAATGRKRPAGWWVGPLVLIAGALILIWWQPWNRSARPQTVTKQESLRQPVDEPTSTTTDRPSTPAGPTAQVETVTLLPDTRSLGAGGLSGALKSDSGTPFSPPEMGDWGRGVGVRGFLTFNLGELPRDSRVVAARFYGVRGGQTGSAGSDLGTVLIERVDVGDALDGTDFDRSGSLVSRINLSDLRANEPLDVLQAVRLALRNDERAFTLRFRFSRDHNGDDTRDLWAFRHADGQTRLEIDLE